MYFRQNIALLLKGTGMLAFYFTWRNPDKGMPHKGKNDFTLKATLVKNHSISTSSLKTTLESLKITSFFFTECKQAFLACQHFKDVSVQKATSHER